MRQDAAVNRLMPVDTRVIRERYEDLRVEGRFGLSFESGPAEQLADDIEAMYSEIDRLETWRRAAIVVCAHCDEHLIVVATVRPLSGETYVVVSGGHACPRKAVPSREPASEVTKEIVDRARYDYAAIIRWA